MATKDTAAPVTAREVLPIAPRCVQMDFATHTRRYWVVNLDPGITLDDIGNKPELWRLCQADFSRCLGVNDCLEIRGEGWTVEAKVSEIDAGRVFLYDIRKANRPSRITALYEDDQYRVGMVGNQFAVYRKRDADPNPFGGKLFATVEMATRFVREQYPSRVA